MTTSLRLVLLSLSAAAVLPAFAGPVQVSFVGADRYADAGTVRSEEAANLEALAAHLRSLGQRLLPADQSLSVEVLDVDLAGERWPSSMPGRDVRIASGSADWPRITVRYTLQSGSQVLRQGQETIADMDYLGRIGGAYWAEPLRHEKRLLDTWFKQRFATAR